MYSVETNKHILKLFQFSPSGFTIHSIFFNTKPYGTIPTATPNWGKNRPFSTNI